MRALYLIWLLRAQEREFGDDEPEPPIPPCLGALTAPLDALVAFLRIDKDLIATAASRSAASNPKSTTVRRDLHRWVASLPEAEKTALLTRVGTGDHAAVHAELRRRHRDARPAQTRGAVASRTVGELLAAANDVVKERRRKETARAAKQRALRGQAAAAAREQYLNSLARREPAIWDHIELLIATKQSAKYDEASQLLCDVRTLGVRSGRIADVQVRIDRLREAHARKRSFVAHLERAGLVSETAHLNRRS